MAIWTSLAVLSAVAVITLSLPGPDGQYNIPRVGSGRRSQFYVLHSDGTYKYGHDTGEGAFESAKLNRPGDLDGEFGYTDEKGNNVNVQYKSGTEGFVARGDHLPAPHPDFVAAHAEASARSPFVDPLADSGTDASYNFQFAGEEQVRTEQSDADGNVRGSYTYTDEDGITRTYTYTAGRETGFVIEGSDLPQGPVESGHTPAATRLSGNRGTSSTSQFSGSRNVGTSSSRRPSSTFSAASKVSTGSRSPVTSFSSNRVSSGSRRASTSGYSASNRASTGSSQRASTHQTRPIGSSTSFSGSSTTTSQRGSTRPDGSYAFSFNAGDHSRSESADANLNIDGQFSFVADDGVQRSVSYQSGANRGFQATGDHLPKPTQSNFGNRISSSTQRQSTFGTTSSQRGSTSQSGSTYRAPAQRQSTFGTTSSQRASTSHSGSTYRAPSVASRPSVRGSTTTTTSFSSQRPAIVSRTPSTSFTRQQQTYSGSSSLSSGTSSRVPFEEANTRSDSRPDGSYAFAYETSSHSRSESGDSDNNVDGKFEFVAEDDGQRRAIEYEAGSDTGFIAEGDHIPVGPEVPGAPSGQPTGRIVPVEEVVFVDPLANTGLDASYNFAFDSDEYSRSEIADADGNVQGSYTVVDDDGTRRTINFRAGKGIGFETEEVAVSRGPRPSRPSTISTSGSSATSFRGAAATAGSSASSSTSFRGSGASSNNLRGTGSSSTSFRGSGSSSNRFQGTGSSATSFRGAGSSSTSSGFQRAGTSSSSAFRGGSGLRATSYTAPSTSSTSTHRQSTSSTFGSSSPSRIPLRSSFTPSSTQEVFPGFQLHQYDASKNPEKFGYVLTFDN